MFRGWFYVRIPFQLRRVGIPSRPSTTTRVSVSEPKFGPLAILGSKLGAFQNPFRTLLQTYEPFSNPSTNLHRTLCYRSPPGLANQRRLHQGHKGRNLCRCSIAAGFSLFGLRVSGSVDLWVWGLRVGAVHRGIRLQRLRLHRKYSLECPGVSCLKHQWSRA